MGVGRDLDAHEFFLARARPEMLFFNILNYKICRQTTKTQAEN
jgi:hypothetical protein